MGSAASQVNLDALSKPERQALSSIALDDQSGQPSAFEDVAKVFGSLQEAQVRLDGMVRLGFVKRVRGGFRPTPQAIKALVQSAQEVSLHQDGLFAAMREHRASHPNCFLAVANGKLVDYDPMLPTLLLRTRDLRSSSRVTIIPPLSG